MREILQRCDICSEVGAKTYVVTVDGEDGIEIDLDEKHAQPILKLLPKGRPVVVAEQRPTGRNHLDARVRGVPALA